MPSFAVLRSFECAARHQSFTLAAEELSLTQSAISRQIKELELAIGADLFRRVGRRVELTERGAAFAADLRLDLERISSTVLPTFASRWLIPRLPSFEARHPDIQIHLSVRENTFNLVREHFDAALHFGPPVWPDGNLEKLCTEVMVAVASPSLIASHGIVDANHLLEAPLIHLETRPQFAMVISGAIASLGAAILPSYLIEAELADGRLKAISDVGLSTNNAYYIATPTGIHNPAGIVSPGPLTPSIAARFPLTSALLKWSQSKISTHVLLHQQPACFMALRTRETITARFVLDA